MISATSLLVATVIFAMSQTTAMSKAYMVSRLRGKLIRVHSIPAKRHPKNVEYETNALRGVSLALYERMPGGQCCDGLTPVAKAKSNHRGSFRFEKEPEGSYWLSAYVDGHDYVMPLDYRLSKDEGAFDSSDFKYMIDDSGNFRFWLSLTVTVD